MRGHLKYSEGEIDLKICYLANAQSIHTKRWISYFAQKGHNVHLISAEKGSGNNLGVRLHHINWPNVRFGMLPFELFRALFTFMKIRGLLRGINPDILHAHYISGFLPFFGSLSGFRPLVVSAWGSDILIVAKRSKLRRFIVKYVLKKADLITCDAEHMKEAIRSLGATPKKISIVNFGVDTRKFSPKRRSERLRKKLGIRDSLTVISLRNLDPIYDVESLIKAVPLVLKSVPEAKFVIAYIRGSQEKELKDLARSLGVSDSVMFVGFIPNDELPQYLVSMDVYVSTSLSDAGLAASTAEAMACGLPVVITDFGDNRKWVEDEVNGFVVPVKDPISLAEKIVYLLKNKDIRTKFGKVNRKIIEERNNYYKEMEKMERIYKELIERHKK
ncbi:MAG: glycosyltransferase family 4 protein [Candidatus Bathyarchaeaceae archaeon]